jgi:hypothetical protein
MVKKVNDWSDDVKKDSAAFIFEEAGRRNR